MKRSIAAFAAILIAALFISCSNSMNTPPVIIGGGNSGTSVSSVEDIQEALANGASKIRLANDIPLDKDLSIGNGVTIDGNGNSFIANPRTAGSEDAQLVISGDDVVLSNITIEVSDVSRSSDPAQGATDKNGFALLVVNASKVTLENVTLTTNDLTSGINVYNSKDVTIKNLTVDNCQRAPINISASTVTIDGAKAKGSDWYGDLNVIQVNGLGGSMHDTDSTINPKSSTVTINNMGNFDAVWQEVVAADYNVAVSINAITAEGQSSVTLDGGVSLLIDDGVSKGWMIVPGENLLNIGNKGFTADDGEVKGNYAVLTDGYYNGSYANTDIRGIEEGSLNMGGNQAQNGIGFYFGTSSSITYDWNNSTQTFKNVVKPDEVYLMQMNFSENDNTTESSKLVVGGNVQAKDNQPGAGGSGTKSISEIEGDVSVIMVVGAEGVTYLVDLQPTTTIPVSGKDYRCGFVAWGDCLVDSIRVDKLNLDASKLAGLMGN